jgi:hypothetical protein
MAAYRHAQRGGLYRHVRGEQGHPLENAYAMANQLEYFAELSCMYFAACNYFPRRRQELQVYDPVGYAMIGRMWRLWPNPVRRD